MEKTVEKFVCLFYFEDGSIRVCDRSDDSNPFGIDIKNIKERFLEIIYKDNFSSEEEAEVFAANMKKKMHGHMIYGSDADFKFCYRHMVIPVSAFKNRLAGIA